MPKTQPHPSTVERDPETFGKFAEGREVENAKNEIWIKPGDNFVIHATAQEIRRSEEQRKELADSLENNGQLHPILYRELPDGTIEVCDGAGRIEIQHGKGQSVWGRLLTDDDLKGRSIDLFIYDMNTAVGGRKLSDVQQAMMAYTCCLSVTGKTIEKLKQEAKDRKTGGKTVKGEKGGPAAILARHAKVKEARIRKVIELAVAGAPKTLFDAVWNGFAISSAVQIAKLDDPSQRAKGLELATSKTLSPKDKKLALKELLRGPSVVHDKYRRSVPTRVLPAFAKTRPVKAATKHIRTAIATLTDASVDAAYTKTLETTCKSMEAELPHAVCIQCEGFGCFKNHHNELEECPTCKGVGFLTKAAYDAAVSKNKDNIQVRS